MDQLSRNEGNANDEIVDLQKEIETLETSIEKVKSELRPLEFEIQKKLHSQISKIQELITIYKRQKGEKKAKRLEQKKRGKNYIEPIQPKIHLTNAAIRETAPASEEKIALKRLYKEAIVHVHPDKISHSAKEEELQKATSLTVQLNGVYKSGNLEELIKLYEYIISGNSIALNSQGTIILSNKPLATVKGRLRSLKKRKAALIQKLDQLKNSFTYQVLSIYPNPETFIEELRLQMEERIRQLERRTRKG